MHTEKILFSPRKGVQSGPLVPQSWVLSQQNRVLSQIQHLITQDSGLLGLWWFSNTLPDTLWARWKQKYIQKNSFGPLGGSKYRKRPKWSKNEHIYLLINQGIKIFWVSNLVNTLELTPWAQWKKGWLQKFHLTPRGGSEVRSVTMNTKVHLFFWIKAWKAWKLFYWCSLWFLTILEGVLIWAKPWEPLGGPPRKNEIELWAILSIWLRNIYSTGGSDFMSTHSHIPPK